jgi:hypothetical protein
MVEIMNALTVTEDGHYLFAGSSTGKKIYMQEMPIYGNYRPAFYSRKSHFTPQPSPKYSLSGTTTLLQHPKQN